MLECIGIYWYILLRGGVMRVWRGLYENGGLKPVAAGCV